MKQPKLKVVASSKLTNIWIPKNTIKEFVTSKGKEILLVELDTRTKVIVDPKFKFGESDDNALIGIKPNFNYSIFGTQDAVEGRDLINYFFETKKYDKAITESKSKEIELESEDTDTKEAPKKKTKKEK